MTPARGTPRESPTSNANVCFAYGYENVALSLPMLVEVDGAVRVVEPELCADEEAASHRSIEVLRGAIAEASRAGGYGLEG